MLQLSKRNESFFELTTSQKNLLTVNILGDFYFMTILETIQEIPKSVMEINYETKIPLSTVYRRMQTLHDLGLLKVSGTIGERGKKSFLYKSKVKSIEAKYDSKLTVEMKFD